MRRLSVLHVTSFLHPRRGGPPAVIVGLAEGQQALGHRVTLLSGDPPDDPEPLRFVAAHVHPPVPLVPVPLLGTWNDAAWPGPAALATIVRALRGTDVVHLHEAWNPLNLPVAVAAKALRVPYVLTPHGTLNPWALGQKSSRKRLGLRLLGYGRLIAGAAVVHALNQAEREAIERVGWARQVRIVGNGVFPDALADLPPEGAFRAAHPGLGSSPYVLFLSRLAYVKGLDVLAQAFALLAPRFPPPITTQTISPPSSGSAPLSWLSSIGGRRARVCSSILPRRRQDSTGWDL